MKSGFPESNYNIREKVRIGSSFSGINKIKTVYHMKKTTTKATKAKKTTKASKKQSKPKATFMEAIKDMLNLDLVSKESPESNKSHQDTLNIQDNNLYTEEPYDFPDETEIIIEVDLDPVMEVEIETLPNPDKIEAEIETPIMFKEEPKESPVIEEAINRETFEPDKTDKKENNDIKEDIKPIEQKKPVITYKQRLEAIKARLNRK